MEHTAARLACTRATLILALLLLLPKSVAGTVIVGDAVLEKPGIFFTDYSLYLTQSIPPGQGLFLIGIDARVDDLGLDIYHFEYGGIAEKYAMYSVDYSSAIDPSYAAQHDPLLSNDNNPGSFELTLPYNFSVLIGFWDDRHPFDSTPTENDLYGWLHLRNTESGLILVDSATAVGRGIYAGTHHQVPEPSPLLLVLLGFGILTWLRHEGVADTKEVPTQECRRFTGVNS